MDRVASRGKAPGKPGGRVGARHTVRVSYWNVEPGPSAIIDCNCIATAYTTRLNVATIFILTTIIIGVVQILEFTGIEVFGEILNMICYREVRIVLK